MKTLLSILLIVTAITASAQNQIPNPSFESWRSYGAGEYPDFWKTSDSISNAIGAGPSAFKSTDPYDGTYSLHLRNVQSPFNIKGPGVATNGVVIFNQTAFTFEFLEGTADTARYRFMTGQFKYAPINADDSGIVKVYLLKNNNTGNPRDTIAAGITHFRAQANYGMFVTTLVYRDFIQQPDTFLIIIQSSFHGLNDATLLAGSELTIDSLQFSGFVGVDELKNSITDVKVYPSPADKELSIDVELKNNINLSYQIFDTRGKLILSSLMNSSKEKVDISSLSGGHYILKIGDEKMNQLYSTNFSVLR